MKFIIFACLFYSFNLSAQLISGPIVDDNRKLNTVTDFLLVGNTTGELCYQLSVDAAGNVTSAKLISEKTSVISTPIRMKGKQMVSAFKFEPGTHFPKFHLVEVRIKVVLEKK